MIATEELEEQAESDVDDSDGEAENCCDSRTAAG